MSNNHELLRHAISEAEELNRAADSQCTNLCRLLVGRLRQIQSQSLLSRLKRELEDYNMRTGTWRERK